MSDALWAARQGDAMAHNSMLADAFGGVLAVAAGVAVGAAVGAAIVGAASLTVTTGGLGACLLGAAVNVAVGVGMNLSGADASISQFCDDLANDLFPPSVCAHIDTGSSNVFINGLPAARAAGAVAAAGAAGVELPEDEPPQDSFLDVAKGFFSELWQPTVASPAPGAVPKGMDQVTCERHAPMPVQYIAEGSDRVFINGQPAVRSGDRSTCEATVVGSGQISSNVRIGGGQQVVRPIRSSKPPGVGLGVNALLMLKGGPRRFTSNLPCMLLGSVNAYGVSQVTGALSRAISGSPHPVHAATGAKVLGGEEDLDFALPGLMPIEWQRFYNSRDTRRDGLFGAGWSVPFEVSVHIEHGPEGGDRVVYIDEQARRIDMGLIAPGSAAFSAGEGLAVRRHEDGRVLIESEDGIYHLFEASLRDPTLLRLAQIGDRNDNRLHLQYDASERLIALCDSLNVLRLDLGYSSQWPGRVEHIERLLADGTCELLASYAYDPCGDLIEVRDSAGNVLRRFAYDSGQRMVEHQLPSGLRCFYDWALIDDQEWRVVGHHTDDGERYRFEYDLEQRSTVVTDGLNRRSTRRWNPQHQITEYSDALGHTWRFHWNEERQLQGATDPQGGQWRYTYDGAGNLESSEDPLGQCELTLWLEHWSLPKTQIDAAGHSWQYRYDARGNCTHAVDPLGHVTRYRYNEFGQVIETIDPSGKSRVQHWSTLGQLVEQIDCSGNSTSFTYDPRGFLHTVTDALGERTLYLHDRYGRLLSSRTPDERLSEYQRNPSGQLTTFSDPAGAATRYSYDRRGQLRLRTDALRRQVQLSYDAYGRLQTLTNENGESYRFAWDSADRLVVQQGLDGSQHHYRYDALNNPFRVEQRPAPGIGAPLEDAIVHELERDALGRLTAKVTCDGRTEYRYDPLDQLTALTFTDHDGQSQELGFSYDAMGQLLSEQTASATLQHHYDELGNLIQTQYPDGRWLNRLYYGSGHLHQINLDGQLISDFERDRLHREVLRTQGPIITRTRYDRSGRLRSRIQRIADQSSPVRVKEYDYDPADNLVTRLSQTDSRKSRAHLHYDATARLIAGEDELARHTETFAYDAAANLLDTARIQSGGIRHNQVTHYQDKRCRYDGFGRLHEKHSLKHGTQRFEYDAESRLIAVRNPNGDVTRMSYDPLGRRIAKRACNRYDELISETRFTWDGLRLLQEETHQRQSLYIYADHSHEPLARVDTQGEFQTVHYFHNHSNGQPEELTDKDGKSVWSAHYQVWGNTLSEEHDTSIEAQNLRFQGQYLDRETGLHYNTFRFYDPDIGRFTTPDPIGLAGGLNLYQYAPNPVGWVDPWGWSCVRVRHYTNKKGLEGIKDSGVILAHDKGRVFVEPASKKPLNEIEAQTKYSIGRGKGKHYVETDVLESELEWVKNPRYHTKELTVRGNVTLKNATFTQRK